MRWLTRRGINWVLPMIAGPERPSLPGDADRSGRGGAVCIYLGSRAMQVIDGRLQEAPINRLPDCSSATPWQGPNRRFIVVTDVVPFALSPEDEGDVRFSPQLFEELYPLWQERRQGASVVGWCHASPKRGSRSRASSGSATIALLPRPWQVALDHRHQPPRIAPLSDGRERTRPL